MYLVVKWHEFGEPHWRTVHATENKEQGKEFVRALRGTVGPEGYPGDDRGIVLIDSSNEYKTVF